jgi:SAM-dependent methyltransferase
VICTAVVKHVPQVERLFAECARVLRPGGTLLIVDPTPFGVYCGLALGHFQWSKLAQILSLERLAEKLAEHGFRLASQERFMLSPRPFPGCERIERVLKALGLDRLLLNQILCVTADGPRR